MPAARKSQSISRPSFSGVLVDADDVAPSIAARLGLAVEPNLRNAIDAVEHGNGALDDAVVVTPVVPGVRVLAGLPSAAAWVHIRPGEVVRVIERLAEDTFHVTVDGLGAVDEIGAAPRNRFGTARALAVEADVIVGVCSATPVGLTRFLSWVVDVRTLAPEAKIVVAMNRAPAARFRRGELYDELARSLPSTPIVFLGDDARVADAHVGRPSRPAGPVHSRHRSLGGGSDGRARCPSRARAVGVTVRTDAYDVIRRAALEGIERRRLQPERELGEVRAEVERAVDDVPAASSAR